MKISGRIKGSLIGAPLSTRHLLWPSTAHEREPKATYVLPYRLFKRPRLPLYKKKICSQPRSSRQSQSASIWVPPPVLVKALRRPPRGSDEASGFGSRWTIMRRAFSSAGKEQETEDAVPAQSYPLDRKELMSFVDGLEDVSVDEQFRLVNDTYLRGYSEAGGPELTVSERMDDKEFPSFNDIISNDEAILEVVREIWREVWRSLYRPGTTDIEHIWNLYQRLPDMKMLHIPAALRHKFMKVLGQEKRNDRSMLRYFAAVADIKNSGLRLTTAEWNQGLSFAGRYVGHTSPTELEAVMKLWQEMESDSDIKANAITFNVLFDVASKAGNFVLAEMLYQEMERRGFKFNRYHHVSLIHLFGLKMNSDGIRAAYKEMVQAGEMIDTTVLNCVIVGFLRCGEESSADRVYERMKTAHIRAPKMPFRNYMSDKVVTKVLSMFSRVSKETNDSDLHHHLQQLSPVVPDKKTFDILVTHYVLRAPAMDKVAQYLDDMKWFQIPMQGPIFLTLFKGFHKHGGASRAWRLKRLDQVYQAFLSARRDSVHGIYVGVWMAKWIMRAFRVCDGEDRMWQIWEELKPYCEIDFTLDEKEYFRGFLNDMAARPGDTRKFRDQNLFGTV